MNAKELKIGDLLEAIDVCEMRRTGLHALKVGKLYKIKEETLTHIIVASEIDRRHLFPKDGLYLFFKHPNITTQAPKAMTIKEKTKLLKALAKVVKATGKNKLNNASYLSIERANEKIQEIIETITIK